MLVTFSAVVVPVLRTIRRAAWLHRIAGMVSMVRFPVLETAELIGAWVHLEILESILMLAALPLFAGRRLYAEAHWLFLRKPYASVVSPVGSNMALQGELDMVRTTSRSSPLCALKGMPMSTTFCQCSLVLWHSESWHTSDTAIPDEG